MITDAILGIMGALLGVVLGILPDAPSGDGNVGSIIQGLGTVLGYGASMGAWMPWSVVVPTLAILTAVLIASGSILLVRLVASFFSGGGGAV